MFTSVFDTLMSTSAAVLVSIAVSFACGIALSLVYKACERPSKSFAVTIAMLPAVVMMVIMMVNDNLGIAVAVAGSFSLVRFRSLPGKASDILIIFMSMALGLCTGMGYVLLAVALMLVFAAAYVILSKLPLLDADPAYRNLRITIPEDLEYSDVFTEVFDRYAKNVKCTGVKTMNLGTMYQVSYELQLNNTADEKKMIDEIRVRNGNLPVISSQQATVTAEL